MGKVIYLAGPMTGYPDFNKDGFAEAEAFGIAQGWVVINPRALDPAHDGPCPDGDMHTTDTGSHPRPCWVRASLRLLLACDAVVMLPGWEASPGALLERGVAFQCGMPVTEL